MDKIFLIGSCRYQNIFPKHFEPRLHTTREILNFLKFQKLQKLQKLTNVSDPCINFIFGDATHPQVKDKFLKNISDGNIFENIQCVALEITSRKIYYSETRSEPLNVFYYDLRYGNIILKDVTLKTLTDEEIILDIEEIISFFKTKNINKFIFISHLDLKDENGNYISSRHELKLLIQKYAENKDNMIFIDLELAFPNDHLEQITYDGLHYNPQHEKIAFDYISDKIKDF